MAQHIYLTIRPEFSGTAVRTRLMSMPSSVPLFLFLILLFLLIIFGMEPSVGLVSDIPDEMAAAWHLE